MVACDFALVMSYCNMFWAIVFPAHTLVTLCFFCIFLLFTHSLFFSLFLYMLSFCLYLTFYPSFYQSIWVSIVLIYRSIHLSINPSITQSLYHHSLCYVFLDDVGQTDLMDMIAHIDFGNEHTFEEQDLNNLLQKVH